MLRLKNNLVLTFYQAKILKIFFDSELGKQFFLTGGTALAAFYLGHRQSNDLDLFTLEPFDSFELEKLIKRITDETSSTVKTKVKTSDYYELYLENEKGGWVQRLDFIKDQPIVFGKKKVIDGISIDSLENIASNKILTIYGRLEPKDYLDLYFIFKETGLDFDKLFDKTKQKDTGLHEFYFANLIAEADKLKHFPKTLKPFKKEELANFYLNLSEKMLKKIKPKSGFALSSLLIVLAVFITLAGGVVASPAVRQVWEKKILSTSMLTPSPTPTIVSTPIPKISPTPTMFSKMPWEGSVCGNGICEPCENKCCNYPCVTDTISGQLMCPPPTCLGYCPKDCQNAASCQTDTDCPILDCIQGCPAEGPSCPPCGQYKCIKELCQKVYP